MPARKKVWYLVVFLLLVVLCLCSVIAFVLYRRLSGGNGGTEVPYEAAIVKVLAGSVEKSDNQQDWTSVHDEDQIESGYYVRTLERSRALLIFADNSVTTLGENTVVELEDIDIDEDSSHIDLTQIVGDTWTKVVDLFGNGDTEFSVETPTSVAMVRGTVFAVGVDEDADEIFVTENEIEIMDKKTKAVRRTLAEGKYLSIDVKKQIAEKDISEEIRQTRWYRWNVARDEVLSGILGRRPKARFLFRNMKKLRFEEVEFDENHEEYENVEHDEFERGDLPDLEIKYGYDDEEQIFSAEWTDISADLYYYGVGSNPDNPENFAVYTTAYPRVSFPLSLPAGKYYFFVRARKGDAYSRFFVGDFVIPEGTGSRDDQILITFPYAGVDRCDFYSNGDMISGVYSLDPPVENHAVQVMIVLNGNTYWTGQTWVSSPIWVFAESGNGEWYYGFQQKGSFRISARIIDAGTGQELSVSSAVECSN